MICPGPSASPPIRLSISLLHRLPPFHVEDPPHPRPDALCRPLPTSLLPGRQVRRSFDALQHPFVSRWLSRATARTLSRSSSRIAPWSCGTATSATPDPSTSSLSVDIASSTHAARVPKEPRRRPATHDISSGDALVGGLAGPEPSTPKETSTKPAWGHTNGRRLGVSFLVFVVLGRQTGWPATASQM